MTTITEPTKPPLFRSPVIVGLLAALFALAGGVVLAFGGPLAGAEITFELEGGLGEVSVFTTRPDTLFGVTFLTLAPEHPMAEGLMQGRAKEDAWSELRDEVALLSEFDRIKQMKAKKLKSLQLPHHFTWRLVVK